MNSAWSQLAEAVDEEDDVAVKAKNVHIDLSPHEHDDVYEGVGGVSGLEATDPPDPECSEANGGAWDALGEGPLKGLDWKKTAKKALNKLSKHASTYDTHVPKGAKKVPQPKSIRGGEHPDDDPLKTASTAEYFQTDHGDYFVYKGMNQRYYALFVSADKKDVQDLGEHADRKQAVDAVLEHHDKQAAGLGEDVEEEGGY